MSMKFRRPFLTFSLVLLLVPSFVWAQQPALKTIPATALARPDARDRQIVSFARSCRLSPSSSKKPT
jgi:hypothetical protein